MAQDNELKSKYGQDPGFKVPEGYFDQLKSEIMDKLPEMEKKPAAVSMTPWQRVKPYVYMAAMFAGIWLMMNLFHRVSDMPANLDNPPEHIASAMLAQPDYEAYVPYETDYSVEQEVSEAYQTLDDFQRDFGYDLKPEYASLTN